MDASAGVRLANRIANSTESQTRQQIGEVLGAVFHGDHFADVEQTVDVADHDPVFGFAFDGNDDLAAIREVSRLQEVVQRLGPEGSSIQGAEEGEYLSQERRGSPCQLSQVFDRFVDEENAFIRTLWRLGHNSSRSIPN